jgi:cytochrome c-type biogenesis protein CcmE
MKAKCFFDFIHEAFEYFTFSDTILEGKEVSLKDFGIIVKKVENVLGKEDSIRFFRAVYDALPKVTIKYLGIIVSVFETWKN